MAVKEIRISTVDLNHNGSPEVLLELYDGKEIVFSTSVSSSKKNGNYDKVDVKGDADNDGDFDAKDDELFIALAKAAVNLLK